MVSLKVIVLQSADMSLKVLTKIPYGNCRIISTGAEGETAEVQFTPEPNGGPECLWFCFRLLETKPEEATAALLNHLTANPKRLGAVYRYLEPNADIGAFTAFLKTRLNNPSSLDESDYEYLYQTYGPDKFDLYLEAFRDSQCLPLDVMGLGSIPGLPFDRAYDYHQR